MLSRRLPRSSADRWTITDLLYTLRLSVAVPLSDAVTFGGVASTFVEASGTDGRGSITPPPEATLMNW